MISGASPLETSNSKNVALIIFRNNQEGYELNTSYRSDNGFDNNFGNDNKGTKSGSSKEYLTKRDKEFYIF